MSFAQFGSFLTSHFSLKDKKQISPLNVGFMEIDSDFVIRKAHDRVLSSLFGSLHLCGQNFEKILKERSSSRDYKKIQPVLQDLVLKKDVINSAMHATPLDCLKICVPSQNGRCITKFIRIEFRKSENFLKTGFWTVVVRDISKSVRISKQIRRSTEKAELKINTMMSLLQFERDLVKEFLESTIESLRGILMNLSSDTKNAPEVRHRIENIFSIVHQIKGDAAILNLDSISTKAHRFESLLSALNKKHQLDNQDLKHLAKPLKSIIDSVKEVKDLFEKIVEGGWNRGKNGGGDSMMRRLQYLVKRLSGDNKKRIIVVDDGYIDSAVPLHLRRVVSSVVTQLARNSIVHGIEDTKTRLQRNKTPYGCLHISVAHIRRHIVVTTRDDGRGIDPAEVKKAALRSDLFDGRYVARWNKTQLLHALFKPGFSTADKITQHAGRGVGLDLIKNSVEKHGGTISLKSVPGEFTEFSMSFPRKRREKR